LILIIYMAHYNFNKDLNDGEKGENLVIEHLKKLGGTLIHKNNDNRYDALIERKDRKIKYEIKTDFFCKPTWDTGNIFVEVECRGKESGILVTEAEWFVTYYKFLDEIWYIKTKDMIRLIQDNEYNLIFKTFSGDSNSNTKGWLVPRWKFVKEFKIYNAKTFEKI
jgi:Holliday junction resolvase-like predicted endonuclease